MSCDVDHRYAGRYVPRPKNPKGRTGSRNIHKGSKKDRQQNVPITPCPHWLPGLAVAAGRPFWQLLPALELDADTDIIFNKSRPNAFLGTKLAQQLNSRKIEDLYLVGMKTQFCIDATCRAAADLGFKPVVVADAHTCMDTPVLPAQAIIEHHNATLGAGFARLIDSADVTF